jgi:hypothetical protein
MMTRSKYVEELAERIEKETSKRRRKDASTVAFLSVRADVEDAIKAGFSLVTIHRDMRATGRLDCSYETFRQHVHRFIKGTPAAGRTKNKPKLSDPKKPVSSGIPVFKFNPTPNKEDLL